MLIIKYRNQLSKIMLQIPSYYPPPLPSKEDEPNITSMTLLILYYTTKISRIVNFLLNKSISQPVL